MDNWDEIRTAYHVARAGTVSGAAADLGVHHATVIRHIDALEARLNVKLFQRHARGYTATEAGQGHPWFEDKKADEDHAKDAGLQTRDLTDGWRHNVPKDGDELRQHADEYRTKDHPVHGAEPPTTTISSNWMEVIRVNPSGAR